MSEIMYFFDREEWRDWLKENHSTRKEVWLVHYKKHTSKPGISYDDAVEEALCFGWIDGLLRSIDSEKYVLRYSPRRKRSVWSELNRKRANKMIRQGRMTGAGLEKINQAKENGEWEKAGSRERLEVPPDLKKALAEDKEAGKKFRGLTPSRKKQFLYWMASAKKEETRQRRIEEILKMVKEDRRSLSE